jgi:hypothetical protein
MANNTINLPSEIEQQLEYWKIEKEVERKAVEARRAREDWIMSQMADAPMTNMSKTLHTDPGVDITLKQERVFNQLLLLGVASRRPHLVGSFLKVEYKVDGRQLNSLIASGLDEDLKAEMEGTFTVKTHRPSFREVK